MAELGLVLRLAFIQLGVLAVRANESPCELAADKEECVRLLLQLALYLLEDIVFELHEVSRYHVFKIGLRLLTNHRVNCIYAAKLTLLLLVHLRLILIGETSFVV